MRRVGLLLPLLAALIEAAAAQDVPREFPLDKSFKAISISGYDVQTRGLTFTVSRDRAGNRLVASGSTGCNNWTATVVLREEQIDFADLVTTKKHCGRGMTTEEAFLTTLKSAHRWRLDGAKLILEGEAARLLLTASVADKPGNKPPHKATKKPAKQPPRQPQASR
jgi:heat shock protein HslJ